MDPTEVDPTLEDAPLNFPLGNRNELLKVTNGECVLALLCGCLDEDVRPIKRGELTVVAMRNPEMATLAMVVCFVGRHHWPLGKDSTVLRVGPHRFCFSLPGLLYGVTLPGRCTDDQLRRLIHILRTFCNYQDRSGGEESDFCTTNPEGDFWASAYPSIVQIINPTASSSSDASITNLEIESPPPRWAALITGEEPQSPRAMKVHRALKLSTVTKMVARALLRGLINQYQINVIGDPTAARPALASVRVVSDVVDVADLAENVSVGSPLPECCRRFPAEISWPFWMFDEGGLLFMLQMVTTTGLLGAASTAAARGATVQLKVNIETPRTGRNT